MTPELLEAGAEAHARALTRVLTDDGPVFNQGVALYVEDLKVAFDGFQALGGLSFTVGVGELRCVIGPNGAGKTTTMDCITGKTRPDSGRIFFGSNLDLRMMNEAEIARAGIGRKFQKPTVFEALTVAENLELALAGDRRARFAMRAKLSGEQRERMNERDRLPTYIFIRILLKTNFTNCGQCIHKQMKCRPINKNCQF